TLAWGYLGGLLMTAIIAPGIGVLALIVWIIFFLISLLPGAPAAGTNSPWDPAMRISICLGLVLMFWLAAKIFLGWAQRYIADRERTRHWYDEPVYRRTR